MSIPHWLAVAAVAVLPLTACAQESRQPGPTDANATVPPVGYVSAFDTYRAGPEEKTTPDQVWRGAYVAMPGTGPAAPGKPMSMPGMVATPSEPKTDAVPSDPHAGHHTMQGK